MVENMEMRIARSPTILRLSSSIDDFVVRFRKGAGASRMRINSSLNCSDITHCLNVDDAVPELVDLTRRVHRGRCNYITTLAFDVVLDAIRARRVIGGSLAFGNAKPEVIALARTHPKCRPQKVSS